MNNLRKGSAWTRIVHDWCKDQGWVIEHKAIWMERGCDLIVRAGRTRIAVEAKNHRTLHLSEWVKQAERQAVDGTLGVVIAKRVGKTTAGDAFVIMTGNTFKKLLEGISEPLEP